MFMFGVFFLVAALVLLIFWMVSDSITWKEALLQLGAQTILIIIIAVCIKNGHMSDAETISGLVVTKTREKVHCRHSYRCHCVTVCSGGKTRTCSTICQTCYHHSYDVDWYLTDTNRYDFYIDKVDWQGLEEPPRWTRAQPGDPTARLHSYQNYIKADPDSLFASSMTEEEIAALPKYPQRVYDYHYMDRFVDYTGQYDSKAINQKLSVLNGEIGSSKQVNVVIIVANQSLDYGNKLQRAWEGGKKNDVIVMVLPNNQYQILGISYPDFKVKLRNALMEQGQFTDKSLDVIKQVVVESYKRRPMSEFEYLKETYKPTKGEWIFGLILSIIIAVGLGFVMHHNDVFGEEGYNYRRRRY